MSLTPLLLVVVTVLIMQRIAEFYHATGRACAFCSRKGSHAPWCPARGGDFE